MRTRHLAWLLGIALAPAAPVRGIAAAAPPSQPRPPGPRRAPATLRGVEVTVDTHPVLGDLQKGVVNYKPTFFTPIRPGTALDMVNWLPGFVFEDTRDLRGLEGATGNVLIDGKPPTSKTDTLQSVLKRIPAEQVERIDIIVGGAPGIDMHGRPVIANVILKPSATIQRVATVAETFDTHGRIYPSLSLTSSEKRGGKVLQVSLDAFRVYSVAANVGNGTWLRYGPDGGLQYAADSSFKFNGPIVIGSGVYQLPLAGGTLKFNGSGRYTQTRNHETELFTSQRGRADWTLVTFNDQGELGANYQRTFGTLTSETQLLERATRQVARTDSELPPLPYLTHMTAHLEERAARTTLRYKKGATFNAEAFAEYAANTLTNRTTQVLGGVAQPIPGADARVVEDRSEAGVTTSWKPSARFALDTTLKVESSDIAATGDVALEHRLTYWKPRAVVTLSLDKTTQVRLRLEREVGQIDFANFITFADYSSSPLRVGNVSIRPQRDWVGEAVLQKGLWNGVDLTLTARRLKLQDVVDVAPLATASGVFAQTVNIGDGRETDLLAVLTVPMKWAGLKDAMFRAQATYAHSQVIDPVTHLERRLSRQSEMRWEAHWAQDFPALKTNWGVDVFRVSAYRTFRPLGDQFVGGWLHANVFVEHRIGAQTVLHAEVQNLPAQRVFSSQDYYTGLKGLSALSRVDQWRLTPGPFFILRLRRTLN